MGRSRRDPASYEVGYRKPPAHGRFQPGHSGNPRGRPKGSRPVGAILQGVLQQKVAVTEHGRTRKLPVLEVMLRRLAADAMRSDARALKMLLSLADRYGGSGETAIDLGSLLAEDLAILQHYTEAGQCATANGDDASAVEPPRLGGDRDP
jgi:hypothetical protein